MLLSVLGLWAAEGYFNVPVEQSLNQTFPNIKPVTVRDMLLRGQGSKETVTGLSSKSKLT